MVLWKTFSADLKAEMFYGEKFESVNAFINELKNTFIAETMREYL